jgi:hypothetical protein
MQETKIVVVDVLDPALKATYGATMRMEETKAIRGEQRGKWRIRREGEAQTPVTRVADMRPVEETLTTQNLFGQPRRGSVYETKGLEKKTRVAWIRDDALIGGAEISGDTVARVGTDCGFDVNLITPKFSATEIAEHVRLARVLVLNNVWQFDRNQMAVILAAIYADQKPYVKYEHDHREIGRPDFSTKLFARSALNVFLSPVHLENHRRALGCEGVALPLAIDVSKYAPVRGVDRRPNSAIVCNVRNFKTWTALQAYVTAHPETSFTVLAKDPVVHGDNVATRRMVAPNDMPALYSEHEYLVHLLDGWGAGERVVFEAALCGCKVVANDRVGHTSWNFDLTDRAALAEKLEQAPYDFWKGVSEAIK